MLAYARFAIGIATTLVLSSSPADPHAYLDVSSPADGTSVASPAQVTLRFTENIEPEFSTLILKDSRGARVSTGKPRQPAANALAVDIAPLVPGAVSGGGGTATRVSSTGTGAGSEKERSVNQGLNTVYRPYGSKLTWRASISNKQ